jgi:Flp pilus assembly protein TadG
MARMQGVKGLIKKFARAQQGAVAITLAIAVLPMMLAGGVALDFVHASSLRTKLQGALDAGALAAASSHTLNDSERLALAKSIFDENWQGKETKGIKTTLNFSIEGSGVRGNADIEVPTALMRLVGLNTMPVGSNVAISIPEGKKAEVALVLDYSGSMTEISGGKVKYVAMRDAATKLVNDLAASAPDRLKVGLVPFSHQVYTSLPESYVAGQTGSGSWTGCTVDRKYPYNITDATPTSNDDSKWGQPQHPSHSAYGCDGYAPRNLQLIPLTDTFATITDQLKIMLPYQYTNIALGAEFGWHVLSPNAPFAGAAAYSDKGTQKVMVLLTDGRQTEPVHGPGTTWSVAQGENNLTAICEAMKADNVTIVTVAFDLRDNATRDRLRNCASDPDKNFFVAEDDDQVAAAFEEIKTQIASRIYISN